MQASWHKFTASFLFLLQNSFRPKIEVLDDDIDLETAMEATSTRQNKILIEDVTGCDEECWANVTPAAKVIEMTQSTAQLSSSRKTAHNTEQSKLSGEIDSDKLLAGQNKLKNEGIAKKSIVEIKKEVEEMKDLSQEEKIWRLAETIGSTSVEDTKTLDEELESLD